MDFSYLKLRLYAKFKGNNHIIKEIIEFVSMRA